MIKTNNKAHLLLVVPFIIQMLMLGMGNPGQQ